MMDEPVKSLVRHDAASMVVLLVLLRARFTGPVHVRVPERPWSQR